MIPFTRQARARAAGAAGLAILCALSHGAPAQADPGAAIFEEMCAHCHGGDGQGDALGYDQPLFGDLSVEELADVIERTMPEGEPELCVGDEARQVARYIYNEFYSLETRARKGLAELPRVELARLTVEQHRNALADLVGRFTPAPPADERPSRRRGRRGRRRDDSPERPKSFVSFENAPPQPGLRSDYFQSEGMNKADALWEQRVDYRIDFDFGQFSPAEGITADQFTIVWQGALLAPETGHYEFRIRTQNGARLYLNNDPPESRRALRDDSDVAGQAAFIDAWVSSGELREHEARIFLLGGRQYPLRLEFFKYLEDTASIRLEWKPPHGTWSVLDQRHLSTARVRRVFVVDAPFPADDRSLGYERGSSVSREWHAAATSAATATATEVVDRLPLLTGIDTQAADPNDAGDDSAEEAAYEARRREDLLKDFVVRFASVAFRRPLTVAEDQFLREAPFADAPDPESALRRAVLFILTSPHFLYIDLTPADEEPSPYAIASRLSFAIWDSIPDEDLLAAAAGNQLASAEEIEAQAGRMLADPRARFKMRTFFHHWLEVDDRDLAKDRQMFPEFDEAVVADLRYSLDQFLDEVLWSESSDYRELLLADYLLLNDRLRDLYVDVSLRETNSETQPEPAAAVASDAPAPDESDFDRVAFPPERRAGLLTHPYLLSAFSYHNNTSPIHRGVFLTRNVVGRPLKPPPVAVAFKEDEFAPDLSMREKITQLTRDQACMSCHSVINPLGFALESYDAVGRWRTSDQDKPIDTEGHYTTVDGRTLLVSSARDIASFAATSPAAHKAFVTQLFRHLVKQNAAAYGTDTINRLNSEFANDDFNMQNLMVRIATIAATHDQPPP